MNEKKIYIISLLPGYKTPVTRYEDQKVLSNRKHKPLTQQYNKV